MRDRPTRLPNTTAAASNSSVILAQSPLSVGNWASAPMKHPRCTSGGWLQWWRQRRDTYGGDGWSEGGRPPPRRPHPQPATVDVITADELRLAAWCIYRHITEIGRVGREAASTDKPNPIHPNSRGCTGRILQHSSCRHQFSVSRVIRIWLG